MNHVTIAMYHFVRELHHTRYPEIKGLLLSQFKEQLAYMAKHYHFVTMQECVSAIYEKDSCLPPNAILLTFDDGYADHFTNVFPVLNEHGIQGCFFPPAKAILEHTVLGVNRIHFVLASAKNTETLLDDVYSYLDRYRDAYQLESNRFYFEKIAKASRFDPAEVVFIKRLLQVELEEEVRNLITSKLFEKYVTSDEAAFSQELYVSLEQLKCMTRNGMYIGSHGHNHHWLNRMSPTEQEAEIDQSLDFLSMVGAPLKNWAMCYPHGGFNHDTIRILKQRGCALALTTQIDIATLAEENAHTLPRLDTNDFPKEANAEPNLWFQNAVAAVDEE